MGWPTPQDYNEAIQNPKFCFSDAELKQGEPALNSLGLPRPISGAFASVYRVDCPSRRWAVRCFLREFADQEKRYLAISDHLRAAKLSCMVGFEFLRKGILVGGRWYPILKMEWIDGESISEYVHQNLTQPKVLQTLARQWIDVMGTLKRAQIAHGDLQHGNILVNGGFLKLIDYDAMYVPALAGMGSHEEGHRNYQHPHRSGRDYHPDLDNFSAWVIFISISALAIDPCFWKLPGAGDECLLFRRVDFEKPRTSKALNDLESSGNPQVQMLVSHFRSILCLPLAQIPSLDGTVLQSVPPPTPRLNASRRPVVPGLPDWLGGQISDPMRLPILEPFVDTPVERSINGAEWLTGHLLKPSLQPYRPIIRMRDRIALWSFLAVLILASIVVGWSLSWASSLILTAFAVPVAIVAYALIILPGCGLSESSANKAAIQERIRSGRSSLTQIERAINLEKQERARLDKPPASIKKAYENLPKLMEAEAEQSDKFFNRTLEIIEARRIQLLLDEQSALRPLDTEMEKFERNQRNSLEQITIRKHRIKSDEQAEIRQIQDRFQSTISQLVKRRASLDLNEQAEISRVIQTNRITHINVNLRLARLSPSEVDGIGLALVERLRVSGISCASDVSYDAVRNVSGIGDAKANGLVAWRRRVESQATSTAPTSLSHSESTRIRGHYGFLRQQIDQETHSAKNEEQRKLQSTIDKYASVRRALDAEEVLAIQDYKVQRGIIETKQDSERKRLATYYGTIGKSLDSDEDTARRNRKLDQAAIQTKFAKDKDRLAAEYKIEKQKAVDGLKKLDEKFDQLNRELFQKRLEVGQAESEIARYKSCNYLKFFLVVLFPNRTT